MNCYICEKAPKPGGTRYGVRPAVGICQLWGRCMRGTQLQSVGTGITLALPKLR